MKLVDSKRFEDKITEACYKNSMDKYIVNLQNSQIVINYADTHKNFLKLYGHKLPILSFDIATDDSILATGSVDKDIRLWDMDFGHSIKTIFAHQ
jgi:U3 small nucleolar RNA-associated protein 12